VQAAHWLRLLPTSLRAFVDIYVRAFNRLYESRRLPLQRAKRRLSARKNKNALTDGPLALEEEHAVHRSLNMH
jgi:hypothetical protein